ncbi:hypothetical protein SAMN05192534_12335 [Alteribacillus persepolensis]|uniref:Uncharacterized protein n=1 Tax=Alteribacillus persepolensis TaxID=568899 RepID=A0A1G8I8K3_9BACI|nr:hypothetical protein [Alteribacillus persepolensis]SDI15081.1 hypothetical protein SAMN05192534_12335 [Alteribacillus persepolensis]
MEYEGIRNPKVERKQKLNSEVTTYYMSEEERKQRWGDRMELTKEAYEKDRADGMSNKAIADKYKMSEANIYYYKKKWEQDERNKKESTVQQLKGEIKQGQEKLKEERDRWKDRALKAEEYNKKMADMNEETVKRLKEMKQERDKWKERTKELDADLAQTMKESDYKQEEIERLKEAVQLERTKVQALEEKLEQYENVEVSDYKEMLEDAEKENEAWKEAFRAIGKVI